MHSYAAPTEPLEREEEVHLLFPFLHLCTPVPHSPSFCLWSILVKFYNDTASIVTKKCTQNVPESDHSLPGLAGFPRP